MQVMADIEQVVSYNAVKSSFILGNSQAQTFYFPTQGGSNFSTSALSWLSSTLSTWEFCYPSFF